MKKNLKHQQNYPIAPIIEAVIDFKVLPANDINFVKLEQAVRESFSKEFPLISKQFPLISKQFQNEFLLQTGEDPCVNPIISNAGLRFTSEDGKQMYLVPFSDYQCPDLISSYKVKLQIVSKVKGKSVSYNENHEDSL